MRRHRISPFLHVFTLAFAAVALVACAGGDDELDQVDEEAPLSILVSSAAFTDGSSIPPRHICDGEDRSPPLSWSDVPSGTGSIALIVDDPDAPGGTWVHWVLYGITPDATGLREGIPSSEVTSTGAFQGKNDFNQLGYRGPCPPRGDAHRYFFKVYALDTDLELEAGLTKNELLRELSDHILARGQLMGKYQRE